MRRDTELTNTDLTDAELDELLHRLDGQSYGAYKQLRGQYQFDGFTLCIDAVQGDPFAAPSRVRVQVPQQGAAGEAIAGFPPSLYQSRVRAMALGDYLARQFEQSARQLGGRRGSGKSGLIAIATPGQEVLERTSVRVTADRVEARFVVGLPAQGRRILGRQAADLLCDDVLALVEQALLYERLDADAVQHHVETVEDAVWLRQQLAHNNLVAFVPNGAILPRASGISDRPLTIDAIPFQSPPSLAVQFDLPHAGPVDGMGIPKGVTLIVGGGYHGKSTLLEAIALGIYNHIPGDGREQLVADARAVKIRAEDGRRIAGVNISPFINQLPQQRSTVAFTSDNASGSTSQAASIIEAMEAGATVLLVDEDTSATNFMIRDRRMQALIAKDQEPITPFVDKIRQLYEDHGVSTILVMGGSGDYFDVADTVIGLCEYQPQDLTAQAKAIAQEYRTHRTAEGGDRFGTLTPRIPVAKRLDSPRSGRETGDRARPHRGRNAGRGGRPGQRDDRGPKIKVQGVNELRFGQETIDLAAVEQLMDEGQLRGIGHALAYLQEHYLDNQRSLAEIIALVMADIEEQGLEALTRSPTGDMAQFRGLELAAALSRLRSLDISG